VKEQKTNVHLPISVSICSNVPGFTEAFSYVEQSIDLLVGRMIEYMERIQQAVLAMCKVKWANVFTALQTLLDKWSYRHSVDTSDTEYRENTSGILEDFFVIRNISQGENVHPTDRKIIYNEVLSLCRKFVLYCSQLIVLSYNGSRYDIKLIKSSIVKHLELDTRPVDSFIVKRGGNYAAITCSKFKFLDVCNYLSAGTSYSNFLKTFQIEESKQFFPYEFLDCFDKLKLSHLPPYSAYFSTLKNVNVLEADFIKWEKGGKKGPRPLTGEENYAKLQQLWIEKGFKSIEEYLCFYNSCDVRPMVKAISKMFALHNNTRVVDLFKISLSLPGLSRHILFNHARLTNTVFSLIGKENEDLYHLFRRNSSGGPSLVFKRKASVDETLIRGNHDKPCKNIHSIDCNGLYTYCFLEEMPTGVMVRRRYQRHFKPEVDTKHLDMYIWLFYESKFRNIEIQTYLSHGKEVRAGPYLVDGFCAENNTIFEVSISRSLND